MTTKIADLDTNANVTLTLECFDDPEFLANLARMQRNFKETFPRLEKVIQDGLSQQAKTSVLGVNREV